MTQPGGNSIAAGSQRAGPYSPTPRQLAVLRFIAGYAEAHGGVMPAMQEIAAASGLKAKSTVFWLVRQMEDRGLIRRLRYRARAMDLMVRPAVPRAPDGAPLYFVPVPHGAGHTNEGEQDHG